MTSPAFICRRDLAFYLYELLRIQDLAGHPGFVDSDRDSIDAMLEAALEIAQEQFFPLAARMDREEPRFDGQGVHVLPEAKAALARYLESGFIAGGFDREVGGLQLPQTVDKAIAGIFSAANVALAAYPGLTSAAARLLNTFGSPEQRARYVPQMLSGRFFGTMCLSESQAGSSLSDIRTRATPTEAGDYRIEGSKMWISCGDHDLSSNIVHLVLARLPDSQAGVRGISLFVVPKYRVEADGGIGRHNGVDVVGLNHKMGSRGTSNTVLNFGASGECRGELLGEPNRGLACMFEMMNEARLGVGLAAASLAYAGYLYSLGYAKTRRQGRRLQDKDPRSPQVPLIEHADIRRLLLQQKCYVEGAMALVLYCARLLDDRVLSADPAEVHDLGLLLELLTPIAKSWPSEFCLEASKQAIQILGGYGYSREYPVERLYRDNRLNLIHEGAHGIHGIDILGRKVRLEHGRAFDLLSARIRATAERAATNVATQSYASALLDALEQSTTITRALVEHPDLARSLAHATVYLDSMGTVVVAWLWLQQALVAVDGMSHATRDDQAFYEGKVRTCRYFFIHELPPALTRLRAVAALDDTALTMPVESFAVAT